MAWIDVLDHDETEGFMKSVYDMQKKERGGRVSNIVQIHSLSERSFKSFMEFSKMLFFPSELERQTKEMIDVVVSVQNECHY